MLKLKFGPSGGRALADNGTGYAVKEKEEEKEREKNKIKWADWAK